MKIYNIELLSTKRVHSFRFIREEEVAFLVDSIFQSCLSAIPIHLTEKITSFTANLLSSVAFGNSIGLNNFNYRVINDAIQMTEIASASNFFPYLGWIVDRFRQQDCKYEKVFREMDSVCQKLMDDRMNNEKQTQTQEHEDIIDVLLEKQRTQSGSDAFQITNEQIKALIVDIFLAGTETNAATMIWAMTELVRNPSVMKKTQNEIRNFIRNKGKVSEIDIDKLQCLQAVVKETLRLHPPIQVVLREVTSQFNIDGYEICPNTHIQVNIWAIGQNPEIWETPEKFIPERFMDSFIDFKGRHFEFLPFGSGRRICPGIQMATANMELMIANLLYCFDWKLPGDMEEEDINMEEEVSIAFRKKEALKLLPIKYKLP